VLHFGQASAYGIFSNLLTVPVFTLWVMPTGLLGHILAPWLGSVAFSPAVLGSALILDVAQLIARLPPLSMEIGCLVAGLALGLRIATRRFVHASWRKALPSGLACFALIVACWQRGLTLLQFDHQPASIPEWVILGSKRTLTQIVPANNNAGEHLPFACIQNPSLSPSYWPSLIKTLGYQGVAAIEESAKQSDNSSDAELPPHIHDLRRQLQQHGLFPAPSGNYHCSYLNFTFARQVLYSCLQMSQQDFSITRANVLNNVPECFINGAWKPNL